MTAATENIVKTVITQEYALIILGCAISAVQVFIGGFSLMPLRKKYFTSDFLQSNFGELHKTNFGDSPAINGYPDTGNGIYTDKLSFAAWMDINLAQRVHANLQEFLINIIIPVFIASIGFPQITVWTIYLIILGRIGYVYGYKKDPKFRYYGFIGMMACVMVNIGLSVTTIVKLANH